jgi:hypothetical protein
MLGGNGRRGIDRDSRDHVLQRRVDRQPRQRRGATRTDVHPERCDRARHGEGAGELKALASNNTVRGNIIGDKAEVMDLRRNTLDGSIDIKEGETDDPGGVDDVQVFANNVRFGEIKIEKMAGEIEVGVARDPSLGNTVPRGNIFLQENRPVPQPPFFGLEVSSNVVGGNLQVFKTFGSAPKSVNNNRVRQNLQCKENAAPFTSSGNTAGKFEDQCPA